MYHKLNQRLACAGFAILLTTPAFAQSAIGNRTTKAPVSNDSSPRKRTVADEASAIAAATAAPVTGTFVAKFTIKLSTAVPSGSEVLCVLNASTFDENTTTGTLNNEIEESKSAKATVSGSTGTCTVSLPYSWNLSSASSDTVNLTYQLYIVNSSAVNEAGVTRTSSQFVPGAGSIKVPTTGSTTTYTISATI